MIASEACHLSYLIEHIITRIFYSIYTRFRTFSLPHEPHKRRFSKPGSGTVTSVRLMVSCTIRSCSCGSA